MLILPTENFFNLGILGLNSSKSIPLGMILLGPLKFLKYFKFSGATPIIPSIFHWQILFKR